MTWSLPLNSASSAAPFLRFRSCPALELREQAREQCLALLGIALCVPRPHARQGLAEAFLVEGLQEIVHGTDLESLERVSVVGRDEHQRGELLGRERARQIDAVQRVHLNVEKQELRAQLTNGGKCRAAVAEFADDVEVALGCAEFPQRAPAGQLVVHDDDVQHATQAGSSAAAGRAARRSADMNLR